VPGRYKRTDDILACYIRLCEECEDMDGILHSAVGIAVNAVTLLNLLSGCVKGAYNAML
jgi:hypothetical protein